MLFKEFDARMRVYETAHDQCVLPGVYMVARLDGRCFTRLTKVQRFERPFDVDFRDHMVAVACHLMRCGFNATYAYIQSDEISLLFDLAENTFGRKLRKLNSVLAGEASAKFTKCLGGGDMGVFDCRISQLPRTGDVVDYFRWRQEDAYRNALHGHCYWMLRGDGRSASEATSLLSGSSSSDKQELLFSNGTNFNGIPLWHKRGTGIYWETYKKKAANPVTGDKVDVERRRIRVDFELPIHDEYALFVRRLIGVLT